MMKKIIIATILSAGILFANSAAKAQGTYVKLGAGYNFGVGSINSSNVTQNGSGSTGSNTFELVKTYLGKGVNAGAAFGYMFNENVGAELGIDYLVGDKSEIEFKETSFHGTSEVYSRMLLLKPSLVISAGKEGLNPYARFGIVAAKGTVHEKGTATLTSSSNITTEESELEYSGGWALGMQGGLGVEYNLSDNMAFYSELTMSNLAYSPDRSELTKLTENGADKLSEKTTNYKETEYTDEYTQNSSVPRNDSEPNKQLKFSMPFGSVGIGVGLKFKF